MIVIKGLFHLIYLSETIYSLAPHLHIIALDGVYTRYGELERFRNAAPRGALDVNGVALTKAAQSLASATIGFGLSNLATTSVNCQAMTLNNIKDGGTYSLVVTGRR